MITLLLMLKSDAGSSPGVTPQQIEQIIQQVKDDPTCVLPDMSTTASPRVPDATTIGGRLPKGHEACVCGSGKRYRDCCRQATP